MPRVFGAAGLRAGAAGSLSLPPQAHLPPLPHALLRAGHGREDGAGRSHHRHAQLWSALDKLENELAELLNDSTSQPRISRLAEMSAFIHDLLKNHIFKEDNILYPMAKQMLTPEEILELSERMIHEPIPVPPSV